MVETMRNLHNLASLKIEPKHQKHSSNKHSKALLEFVAVWFLFIDFMFLCNFFSCKYVFNFCLISRWQMCHSVQRRNESLDLLFWYTLHIVIRRLISRSHSRKIETSLVYFLNNINPPKFHRIDQENGSKYLTEITFSDNNLHHLKSCRQYGCAIGWDRAVGSLLLLCSWWGTEGHGDVL